MNGKKELIVEAAEEVFARFGFKKSTIEDIASKAHMGKATLYYYFSSKEKIFGEVIRKDSELFQAKLNEAISIVESPEAKLRAYIATRMLHLKDLSKFYTTLTSEYLDYYFFVEKIRRDFYEYENQILTQLLQEGIDQDHFSIDNIELTSRMISTAIKGLEYPLLLEKNNYNPIEESNRMLDIIFIGIRKRKL